MAAVLNTRYNLTVVNADGHATASGTLNKPGKQIVLQVCDAKATASGTLQRSQRVTLNIADAKATSTAVLNVRYSLSGIGDGKATAPAALTKTSQTALLIADAKATASLLLVTLRKQLEATPADAQASCDPASLCRLLGPLAADATATCEPANLQRYCSPTLEKASATATLKPLDLSRGARVTLVIADAHAYASGELSFGGPALYNIEVDPPQTCWDTDLVACNSEAGTVQCCWEVSQPFSEAWEAEDVESSWEPRKVLV
jgi:hypothetical protein